ncbi:MAG: S8 family serine peptidase [Ignavibacteriaceae bacterium]|nr:S8 family serine peptidase [Ignavibacteriaceae bacterium]
MYRSKLIALLFIISSCLIFAQDSTQTFLSIKSTGVEEFLTKHPDYDGRGTIIFILDTGVDMGIEGLTKTSEGKTKVIDVRDFSGEGNLTMYKADVSGNNFTNEDMHLSVKGADKLKSKDNKYFIGAIKEKNFVNSVSGVSDLNGNGKKDDVYIFVAFIDDNGDWTAYFDTNCNGDLSDEKPIKEYHKNFDTFKIFNPNKLTPFTFAMNILPGENILSLHFDDGSHGTHVAGITSGYMLNGTYLKGVAPGANIISLKIGNNNFPGGATVTESMKKAYLYADTISKQRKEPCIVNMSFGIASEIEGNSEMEKFLDELMKNNPYLYICVANGNDGPGISTAGLPSCSEYVFSTGAVLTDEVARDLYGAPLTRNVIFQFSGRGGEANKPDVVSPGACVSTVPNFSKGDLFQGTSMASPYSTGVMSLILSAFVKEYPDLKIPSQLLYKIVRESAVKMDGYSYLDQGSGYINIMKAWDLLKKYVAAGEIKNFEKYSVNSFAPGMPFNMASALYIRDGSYLTGDESFKFHIKRENSQKAKSFYRIYNLSSDCDWLLPVQRKTYIRNNSPAVVNVSIDKSKIINPGLYCGKIRASRDDKSHMPEFEMLASVIIPYEFNSANNYKIDWKNEIVDPGMLKRYFIKLPAGQTIMHVGLNSIQNKYALVKYHLASPDGEQIEQSPSLSSPGNNSIVEKNYYNLEPGVYELIVEGSFSASSVSTYDFTVSFSSIQRIDDNKLNFVDKNIDLVNPFNQTLTYSMRGRISGYSRSFKADLNSKIAYKYPFSFKKGESEKNFHIILSKHDFNKVTDFTFEIVDSSGFAVSKGGLEYRTGDLNISAMGGKKEGEYNLLLIPAFTNAKDSMTVTIQEETDFEKPKNFDVKAGAEDLTLYPSVSNQISLDYSKPDIDIPADALYQGKIIFSSSNKTVYILPLCISPK